MKRPYRSSGWGLRVSRPFLGGLLLLLVSLPVFAAQPRNWHPPARRAVTLVPKHRPAQAHAASSQPVAAPAPAAAPASMALPSVPDLSGGNADLSGLALPAGAGLAAAPPATAYAAPAINPPANAPARAAPSISRRAALLRAIARANAGSISQSSLLALVSRASQCLAAIEPLERQALVLRTGMGQPQPYNAWQVAHILRVSVAQEHQLERNAAAALMQAAATTGCARPRSAAGDSRVNGWASRQPQRRAVQNTTTR